MAAGIRLLPWSSVATRWRGDWWTRIRGYGTLTLGMTQINFSNKIEDPGRESNIDYTYSGTSTAVGARLNLVYQVSDWFVLTLFEGSVSTLQPAGSKVTVRDYTVSGRNEGPLAMQTLAKEFDQPWVMSTMQWGFEIFL